MKVRDVLAARRPRGARLVREDSEESGAPRVPGWMRVRVKVRVRVRVKVRVKVRVRVRVKR